MDLIGTFDIIETIGIFSAVKLPWVFLLCLSFLLSYTCWKNAYEYNTFAQCVTAIGGNEATIMISNEQAIPDNQIIPANITLRFIQGGTLNIATGKTVTINGHVDAGLYQIFEGDGSISFGSGAVKEVYPQWWGIDGSDDHLEIQMAFDSLPSDGGRVLLPDSEYALGGRITIPSYTTFSGVGPSTRLVLDDEVNDRLLVNSDRVGGNANIVIENLYIDGNKDGQSVIGPGEGDPWGNRGCLHLTNITNLVIRNCIIENAWAAGIEIMLCNNVIISGNRIHNSADDGIGVNYESFYVTVRDNIISDAGQGVTYGGPMGIEVQDGCHDFTIVGNVIRNSLDTGIYVGTHAGGPHCYHGTISANILRENEGTGISIVGIAGEIAHDITVVGNTIDAFVTGAANAACGIAFNEYVKNCIATGNVILNTLTWGIKVTADDCLVEGNFIYDNAGRGILIHTTSENIRVANNIFKNNATQIDDDGVNTVFNDQHSDLFMDVLAVSATHVRNNEDLSAGIPITFTIDAQPDVPRTLSGHFDAHANITAYTIVITGVDARGYTVVETLTEADGWDWETDNAFATITSIIMTARTGTGVGDTMDIGITDVLGLANTIYATGDVFKIKKNNANATVAGAQVDATYCTYDMAVIGLAGGDDFTIWYRSNLNSIL